MNGVVNLYKPPGITSHDAVSFVRRTLGTRRVGHTGTLDPAAEGVLPICIGCATRAADFLQSQQKGYRAVMKLGLVTNTQDDTGEVLFKSDAMVSEEEIRRAVLGFVGEIGQVPPMFSAVKQNGVKLYQLARKGVEVAREARQVTIYGINILSIQKNEVVMEVSCSKGTYIRTLCHDIGAALGCGACMGKLVRTQSGRFFIENSVSFADFEKQPSAYIVPTADLFDYPFLNLDETQAKRVLCGVPIYFDGGDMGQTYKVFGPGGKFLCLSKICEIEGRRCLKLVKMFYEE